MCVIQWKDHQFSIVFGYKKKIIIKKEHSVCYTIEITIVDSLIYFDWDLNLIWKWIFIIFTGGTSKGKEPKTPSILVQHGECSLL